MGLLSLGTPLSWNDARRYAHHVRKHGIRQFLATFHMHRHSSQQERLKWGDEVEYMLVHFDHEKKTVALSLRGAEVLEQLVEEGAAVVEAGGHPKATWHPEYAKYMLEATPGIPYGLHVEGLLDVEGNMRHRRKQCAKYLKEDEYLASICSFPLLGALCQQSLAAEFLHPPVAFRDHIAFFDKVSASHSLFVPDDVISPHPRFKTLTENIRIRRTEKVAINVPVYKDKNTLEPFIDQMYPEVYSPEGPANPGHIYMDAMCFGMGCCCLQVTLQASKICEARKLYDQLAVLTPIVLALSAASPIFRGHLADVDCRWNVIAASVDDRSRVERGLIPPYPLPVDRWYDERKTFVPSAFAQRVIPKSRYDSISTYISPEGAAYNDLDLVVDETVLETLASEDVDPLLARHLAHLFIRDPLVVYRERLLQDDNIDNDHFENIQSTNWQTMRFKPPPTMSEGVGWRVEFRAMEVQLTDFENAAYSVFMVLLSRVILCAQLNLYIPISLVDANMHVAQKRDAVTRSRFWFRKSIYNANNSKAPTRKSSSDLGSSGSSEFRNAAGEENYVGGGSSSSCCGCALFTMDSFVHQGFTNFGDAVAALAAGTVSPLSPEMPGAGGGHSDWTQLSLDDIVNGSRTFIGLLPILRKFLDSLKLEDQQRAQLNKYLDFISDRAAGRIATAANWIRQQVMTHPEYRGDSFVRPSIAYSLLKAIKELDDGNFPAVAPVEYP